MSKSLYDKIIPYVVGLMVIYGLVLGTLYVYKLFVPNSNEFKIEVIGVTDSVNATTLTSIHFECIKFCTQRGYDSYGRKACWDECATLGQECQIDKLNEKESK